MDSGSFLLFGKSKNTESCCNLEGSTQNHVTLTLEIEGNWKLHKTHQMGIPLTDSCQLVCNHFWHKFASVTEMSFFWQQDNETSSQGGNLHCLTSEPRGESLLSHVPFNLSLWQPPAHDSNLNLCCLVLQQPFL